MQSMFTKQPTHAFLVTSIASFRHFGVAPAQSPLAKQAVQRGVVAGVQRRVNVGQALAKR